MQTLDEQTENEAVDWTRRLPDETLLPILLGSVDQSRQLTSVRALSKRFNRIVTPNFWRAITFQSGRDNTKALLSLVQSLQHDPSIGFLVRKLTVNGHFDADQQSWRSLSQVSSWSWLAETYSTDLVLWVAQNFQEPSFDTALSLLIIRLPNLEHFAYNLRDHQDQTLLMRLFEYGKAAQSTSLDPCVANQLVCPETDPLVLPRF